jgi:hypothetical protein
MSQILPIIIVVIAALLAFAAGAVMAKRKGYLRPGEVVARCRRGHLFTTVWAAKASRHQFDLGWARIQRCPVGDHWTIVVPVDDSDLTPDDRKLAAQHRDSAVPDRVVPSRPPRRRRKKG